MREAVLISTLSELPHVHREFNLTAKSHLLRLAVGPEFSPSRIWSSLCYRCPPGARRSVISWL
jgi:hypothetical protein